MKKNSFPFALVAAFSAQRDVFVLSPDDNLSFLAFDMAVCEGRVFSAVETDALQKLDMVCLGVQAVEVAEMPLVDVSVESRDDNDLAVVCQVFRKEDDRFSEKVAFVDSYHVVIVD